MGRYGKAALLILFSLSAAASGANNSDTTWFKDAKYGLFCHYLKGVNDITGDASGTWNASVKAFDVPKFVEQAEQVGAGYVVITIAQGQPYYIAPNDTFCAYTGTTNGQYCSSRDLVGELSDALAGRGIKLMVYINAEGPGYAPPAIMNGLSMDGQANSADFRTKWNAVIADWSRRWGSKVSGWWIDGCWVQGFINPADGSNGVTNLNAMIAACKAGNPNSIVAPNPGSYNYNLVADLAANVMTADQDYVSGEAWHWLWRYPTGRFINYNGVNMQWHVLGYLGADQNGVGSGWANPNIIQTDGTPTFLPVELARYIKYVNQKQGVVTLDMAIYRNGSLGTAPFSLLATAADILRRGAPAEIAEDQALYKPARLMSNYGNYELPTNNGFGFPTCGLDGRAWTSAIASNEYDWNLRIEFPQPVTFKRSILTFPDAAFSTHYQIQYSNNATNWTTFADRSPSAGGTYEDAGSSVTANYVRVKSFTPNGPDQPGAEMAVAGFELYNVGWEFNTDLEGWFGNQEIVNLSAANGVLTADVSGGGDPILYGPRLADIDAEENRYLKIRMKSNWTDQARIFFGTVDQPTESGNRMVAFQPIGDGQWHEYLVDMSVNSEWSGSVGYLRFDPTSNTSGHFEIDYIRPCGNFYDWSWKFNTDGNTEGWYIGHAIQNLTASAGCLKGDVSGSDPFLYSPRNIAPIDSEINHYVKIRMKCTWNDIAQLFFGTADQSFDSEDRAVFFYLIGDGQWHDYWLNMTACPQWKGRITYFRLDPTSTGSSGQFQIDSVRVYSGDPFSTVWRFDNGTDTEGWTMGKMISNFGVANGMLKGDSIGSDPIIYGPRTANINAGKTRYMKIRMKGYWNTQAQLAFGTAAQPIDSPSRTVAFQLIGDGRWHEYLIPMSANPEWAGMVGYFRLDPSSSSGHFEIDYIRAMSAWDLPDPQPPIPGDANQDGKVDVSDLGILAANYGTATGAAWAQGDFNHDGKVDVSDLGILAANYGANAGGTLDFNQDAKALGLLSEKNETGEDTKTNNEITQTRGMCGLLGLPLIAGLCLAAWTCCQQERN